MIESSNWLQAVLLYAILAAFGMPYVELAIVSIGELWFHAAFRTDESKYENLVIQITTLGKEQERVNEIISRIQSYNLPMHYQIWVVLEPGFPTQYDGADCIYVVPEDFSCLAAAKARALEYSRRIREENGMSFDRTLKLLFLDDDVEPTRKYVMTGFIGDYDICQGVTAPRISYGNHGFGHFLLSHMDDMRLLTCLVWCSFAQGVLKRPVYAHGEGLFMTARTERIVTWNYKIFASEDLVVGQNAANLGLRWGWFHEYVELTSPWTRSDYIKQRRRWLWGNIHALSHQGILPVWGRLFVAARHILGPTTAVLSVAGIGAIATHALRPTGFLLVYCQGGLVTWLVAFFIAGWVNSGRRDPLVARSPAHFFLNRLWQSLAAMALAAFLITPAWTIASLIVCLFKGNPRGFETIAKTAKTSSAARATQTLS
jgi:Glycosyl transferase family group 2